VEFGFFEDGFEKGEREVLQLVALHVEVDERTELGGATEDGTEAVFERGDRAVGIGGVNVGRERGDLEREIEARERAGRGEVAEARFGFACEKSGYGVEDLEVALEKGVGLGVADDGFAEEVDGGGDAGVGVAAEGADEVVGRFAGDELFGHGEDVGFDRAGEESGGEGGGGEAGFEGRVEFDGAVAEVFLQMADDFGGGGERREDVDEAEELGLEGGVAHGPVHEARVDAFFGEKAGRGMGVHQGEKFLPEGADHGFEGGLGLEESGRGHGLAAIYDTTSEVWPVSQANGEEKGRG